MVLVQVKGEVDLVCEELVVEVVDCAVWIICVGVVLKALVHVIKQPHADYSNEVPFYTIAEEEMLIIDIDDVLLVYMKIWQVHLQRHQYINEC